MSCNEEHYHFKMIDRLNCVFGDKIGDSIVVPLYCLRNTTGLRIFSHHK